MDAITLINQALVAAGLPEGEVGTTHGQASEEHVTITPDFDEYEAEADNVALIDAQHYDVHLFLRGDYRPRAKAVASAFSSAGLIVDDRRYIEMEAELGLHHYVISIINKITEE